MESNLLIEASAGTGKTQALGERLIELLEQGVKPQEIVALTFSRAAAGEIFERFVSLLAQKSVPRCVSPAASPSCQVSAAYGCVASLGCSGEDAPRYAALLRNVLATQHLSQIGTLDSFLMRIVRAFPHELGLNGELTMMDDYQAAHERARISFSILRRTEAKLKKTFVEAFSLAMNREDVRSFVDSYRRFISKWHELLTARPNATAWGDPETIWGRDPAFAHVTEHELAAAADAVSAAFPGDAKWGEFADWIRAFRGRFGTTKGYVKVLFGSDLAFQGDQISFKFSRKDVSLSREQTLVVRDALQCVFGYVVRMKLELAKGVHKLIAAFEEEYAKKIRAEGKLVFADVPRLLKALPEEKRLALEYRMDARLRAWALDEFQDTSREQWAALANLIDEAKQSDGEKSLFIVGDTKQAIYGWRNGDVSIFTREKNSGVYTIAELAKTYRSGPAIVEAVNRVFARGRIFEEFPGWTCPEHISAKPELGGFVRAIDAPGRTMEDFVAPVYEALKAHLGEKAGDARRKSVAAAVLVRGNKFGELLANRLKALGLEGVVWEGESAILDTPALSAFLDLVQLADHPGDALTYRHFVLTPLAKAKYPNGVPEAAALSEEMALAFTTKGLVRTLRELRECLPSDPSVAWSVFTEERFTEMLRTAAEFELGVEPGTRLADFPRYLAAKKKRNVAEDGKIKIMTIHRSKGLGFDYVVLPLYEYESLNAESDGPLVGDDWVLPDPGAKVAHGVGGLEEAYRLRKDRAEQEALCTYYVAMTRAKKAMTIICHPAGTSLKFSDLVRSADIGELGNAVPRCVLARGVDQPATDQSTIDKTAVTMPRARTPRGTVKRRLPSLQFQSGMSAGSLFASAEGRREALARGTAAHKFAEHIEFTTPSTSTSNLNLPLNLNLPKPAGFVELWREKAFEVFADGEWISGRFDRVTFFTTPEGLSAEIIDFKTSLAHPERYDAQLGAYRRAVHVLTGIPMERITARLMQI